MDVKPNNMMFDIHDEYFKPFVIDLGGCVRVHSDQLIRFIQLTGHNEFKAPEQNSMANFGNLLCFDNFFII